MKIRRIVSAALLVAMLLSLFTISSAAQPRASEHLDSYRCYITPLSGGNLDIHFKIYGTGIMNQIGVRQIILQESSDGTSWSNVKTYGYSTNEGMMGSYVSEQLSYVEYDDAIAGMRYRAFITIYATNGSTSTTRTMYTTEVTAR